MKRADVASSCGHPATESHHEARPREVRLMSQPDLNPVKYLVPGTARCIRYLDPEIFLFAQQQNPVMGPGGLGLRRGHRIAHQLCSGYCRNCNDLGYGGILVHGM